MSDLPRVPRKTLHLDEQYIMESWLTPEFARWALENCKLAQTPRRGERYSQQWRYECYAQQIDPDRERNWPLVWRESRSKPPPPP